MWTCALVSSATRPARPRFFSGTLQDLSHATLQDFAQRLERRKLHPLCVPVVQRVDGRPTEPAPLTRYEASCSENRPGRTRTCSPRFWSPLLATPALERLLILKDLALGHQRRRCWTTPALALFLALRRAGPQPQRLCRHVFTLSCPVLLSPSGRLSCSRLWVA